MISIDNIEIFRNRYHQFSGKIHIFSRTFSFGFYLQFQNKAEDLDMAQIKSFPCENCQRVFTSRQALYSHAAKAHGVRCPVSLRIRDSKCPSCNKIYNTRYLCIIHVRHSKRCKAFVTQNCDRIEQEEFAKFNSLDNKLINSNVRAGRPKHFAFT